MTSGRFEIFFLWVVYILTAGHGQCIYMGICKTAGRFFKMQIQFFGSGVVILKLGVKFEGWEFGSAVDGFQATYDFL